MSDDAALLCLAATLWATDDATDLRLIGGLAVRLLVGRLARTTHDIDVVALTPQAHAALMDSLRARGWTTFDYGVHQRARHAAHRTLIDVFPYPIANPRTFQAVSFHHPPHQHCLDGRNVYIASPTDLALLKITAHRDQDLLDVTLLANEYEIDAAALLKAAAEDDVEIGLAEGAMRFRYAHARGELSTLAVELLHRSLEATEERSLATLLASLKAQGA